jgi:DeoR/GlpR family transcriptional regulator of sugar metabolism
MIANATRVIALIDSSKFERTALSFFAPVDAIDTLVTDAGADPAMLRALRERGVDVIVAAGESPSDEAPFDI